MGSQAFPGILTCAAAVAAAYLLRCVRDEGRDTRRRVDGLRQGLAGLRCKVDALQAHVAGPPAVAGPAFSGATAGMARTGAAAEAGGWGRESEQRADSRPNRIRESFRDGPKGDRTLPWRASGIAGRRALSAARKVRGHALLAFTCGLGSAHLDCLPIGAVNAVKAFDSLNPPVAPIRAGLPCRKRRNAGRRQRSCRGRGNARTGGQCAGHCSGSARRACLSARAVASPAHAPQRHPESAPWNVTERNLHRRLGTDGKKTGQASKSIA